jgi:hypothetical protein
MPPTIDPTLAAAVGRDARATYRAGGSLVDRRGNTDIDAVIGRASGRLALILDSDDCLTGIALETDGGATLIELPKLLSLEVEA